MCVIHRCIHTTHSCIYIHTYVYDARCYNTIHDYLTHAYYYTYGPMGCRYKNPSIQVSNHPMIRIHAAMHKTYSSTVHTKLYMQAFCTYMQLYFIKLRIHSLRWMNHLYSTIIELCHWPRTLDWGWTDWSRILVCYYINFFPLLLSRQQKITYSIIHTLLFFNVFPI